MSANSLSRRRFLQGTAAAGVLAALAGPQLSTRLAFADTATPYTGDVLVVLSFRGGFDGLSAIVPAGDPAYAAWRPNIGLAPSQLLAAGPMFGLHPALAPLLPYWQDGTFGAVHAVGQVDPSRSHFTSLEEMERAAPGTSLRTGWLDRTLGLRGLGTTFQAAQLGSTLAAPSLAGPAPEIALHAVDGFKLEGEDSINVRRSAALRGVYANAAPTLSAPARIALDALDTTAALKAAGYTPANGAVYPDNELAKALREVARLVKAGVGLQVACVDYGDWDMHSGLGSAEQGSWMYDQLTVVAGALAAFAQDLGSTGLAGVTLLTLSEFGRRVGENGSGGVDHGHGNAVLMLGGGVVGGQVHGAWPGLAEADLDQGDVRGATDYRTLLSEVLQKRCGAGSLSTVLPGFTSSPLGIVRPRA